MRAPCNRRTDEAHTRFSRRLAHTDLARQVCSPPAPPPRSFNHPSQTARRPLPCSAKCEAPASGVSKTEPRPLGPRPSLLVDAVSFIALITALAASTFLMAKAHTLSGHAWLGCVALLPLFFSVRFLMSVKAMLAGATWGLLLFVFLLVSGHHSLSFSVPSLALLVLVPGAYAYLAARLTRQIGFSPYLLALGWFGVELALWPSGLRGGLLPIPYTDNTLLALFMQFAGSGIVASGVVYLIALSLDALVQSCVGCSSRSWRTMRSASARFVTETQVLVSSFDRLRSLSPRAPPLLPQ